MSTIEQLTAELDQAKARIAELEMVLAAAERKRKPRRSPTAECQHCGDVKESKSVYIGLPCCSDGKACGRRMRCKGASIPNFSRLTGNPYRSVKRDDRWAATWNGELIGIADTQAGARRIGWDRMVTEREQVAA